MEPPRDYFVPDFGVDQDIGYTQKNAANAEISTGKKWVGGKPPKDPPRDYFVPDFGDDQDIAESQKNLQ